MTGKVRRKHIVVGIASPERPVITALDWKSNWTEQEEGMFLYLIPGTIGLPGIVVSSSCQSSVPRAHLLLSLASKSLRTDGFQGRSV